jgi:hypothetical protein
MNEKEFILDLIKPTPKLISKRCKFIHFLLRGFLSYSAYPFSVLIFFIYDFFTALIFTILWFIISGIIRAKLRNDSIPFNQLENNYDDSAILKWYMAKNICYKDELELEQKL